MDQHHTTFKTGRFMIAPDNVNIVAVVPESNELGFLYNPIQTNALLRPCVTMKYADVEAGRPSAGQRGFSYSPFPQTWVSRYWSLLYCGIAKQT